MRVEVTPRYYMDARRDLAERVASVVAGRLRNRFGEGMHLDTDETPLWMTDTDLANYHTEISAVILRELESVGGVTLDLLLAAFEISLTPSNLEQMKVFIRALQIHDERNARYMDQWKESGWRGALFDLRKKAARLFRQYWGAEPTEGANEDDAWDLINFAAFFIRGREAGNEWGNWL